MLNLEAPQYTRPAEVYGMKVPEVFLSGDAEGIQKRKQLHQQYLRKL